MALNQQETMHVYLHLMHIFPDDVHIARPLIQMLKKKGDEREAGELALRMAQRLLAVGLAEQAVGFLESYRQLGHPRAKIFDELFGIALAASEFGTESPIHPMKSFDLIRELSDREAMEFIKNAQLRNIPAGEIIIRKGDAGESFFLILQGWVGIYLQGAPRDNAPDAILGAGEYFGEFACLYRLPRTATVIALEDCLLLEFTRQAIDRLLEQSPLAGETLVRTIHERMIDALAKSHPILSQLHLEDRNWLAEEGENLAFSNGQTILHGKQPVEACFIVALGQAKLLSPLGEHLLLERGDAFGGVVDALRLPPTAKVVAVGHCFCCRIPKTVIVSLMNAYPALGEWLHHQAEKLNVYPSINT